MRRSLFIVTLLLASISVALGQEFVRPSVSSTAPNTLRHEIIQTTGQNGSLTLRLDKYTGRVFFLTLCPQRNIIGNGSCWKETTVLELPKPANDSAVKFQIFSQAEAARSLLLINNITGQTWQLGVEDGIYKWIPFIEPITLPQSFEIVR